MSVSEKGSELTAEHDLRISAAPSLYEEPHLVPVLETRELRAGRESGAAVARHLGRRGVQAEGLCQRGVNAHVRLPMPRVAYIVPFLGSLVVNWSTK